MNFFILNELTGVESGPHSIAQIQEVIKKGKLKKNALVRRADAAEWQKAGTLLAKLFEQAYSELEQEKRQAKAEREEAKKAIAEQHAIAVRQKKLDKIAKSRATHTTREYNRGTLIEKIFGRLDPSPYWGFQIQGVIINVAIGLVMLATAGSCVLVGIVAIFGLFGSELDAGAKALAVALSLINVLAILLTGFFSVVGLVFFRNVIDWMIDMESHAHAVRKKLLNENSQ